MPDEVVTLKVTLDAAKDIESRLRTMDSLMDSLRKNSNVKLTIDTSSFDKLNSEVQKYIASVTEQVNQQLRLASATQEALSAERQLAIKREDQAGCRKNGTGPDKRAINGDNLFRKNCPSANTVTSQDPGRD